MHMLLNVHIFVSDGHSYAYCTYVNTVFVNTVLQVEAQHLLYSILYVDTDVTYIFIACIHCFICTVLLNFLFTLIYVHSTLTVLLYTSTCTVHVRVPVTVTMQYCFSKHITHRCLLSGYSTGSDFTALYEYKYSLTFYI